jgi:ATP-dependent Clp protease ATP-binding subunit ClpC
MPVYRYPVLLWTDSTGATTAALVADYESSASHAATAEEALRQLKELLEWRLEHERWSVEPDMQEPTLMEVKVEVRPQYSFHKRVMPCPDTIWLRVPCVTGRQENGMLLCSVPHLGLRFNYPNPADLKALIGHYVKEALQGHSPMQLAGRLPPQNCKLDEIVLRDPGERIRRIPPANMPGLKVLFTVADPLLQDMGRGRPSSAAFGRESLSSQLVEKLAREKANILLIGESGVGKSTLLLDAAKKLSRLKPDRSEDENEIEPANDLRAYRFWRGSGARMIAGMRYLGEWEERCEAFLQQLGQIEGVFCAENLLELVQVGGQGPGDSVAAFLLPYLQRSEFRMIAEATPAEVDACRRLFPGFLDAFQVFHVPTFDDSAAIEVLSRIASAQAAAFKLELEPGVVPLIHRLFKRFLPYSAFPGPAATFVRKLCDKRTRQSEDKKSITSRNALDLFIKQTGLPEMFLRDDLPLQIEEVRQRFAAEIIGQPDAITAAARLITTIKTGLNDPKRPLGVLLFCGPTGVGKTALARAIAEFCFGSAGQKDRFIRLDMSEYGGWGAAQRFLQGPEGNPARWIESVRQQPFCTLLFDEIEKASPEVFDVLLGLLDEGRLTDRFGRVTNFRSAIIILTSNLGSNAPMVAGFVSNPDQPYESEAAKFFRPEFFNRLDGVITFRSLTSADIEVITRKELSDLGKREGFVSANIKLLWTDALVALIAREGYDHRFGARPLQRAIENIVVTPLARWRVKNPAVRNATLKMETGPDGITVEAV